jgi:hypothetical protein
VLYAGWRYQSTGARDLRDSSPIHSGSSATDENSSHWALVRVTRISKASCTGRTASCHLAWTASHTATLSRRSCGILLLTATTTLQQWHLASSASQTSSSRQLLLAMRQQLLRLIEMRIRVRPNKATRSFRGLFR